MGKFGPRKEPVMWGTFIALGLRAIVEASPVAGSVIAAFGGVEAVAGGLAVVVGLIVRQMVSPDPGSDF